MNALGDLMAPSRPVRTVNSTTRCGISH